MENASKALLIAGGMLIALLIIGALVLMFNQIGDYEKGQQGIEKTSQIAEFNMEFERYMDDKGIKGADIISLINKVINYNNKAKNGGVNNSVDYNIKMSIKVSNLEKFNRKYAYSLESNKIFKVDSYTIGNDYNNLTNTLEKDLDEAINLENTEGITKEQLKQLSGMYDNSKPAESKKKITKKWKEITGNEISSKSMDAIIKYRQYCDFKTSKFVPDGNPQYKNGQITYMGFKFDK